MVKEGFNLCIVDPETYPPLAPEGLSKALGGLPLAIAYFAGYVVKSQCTIQQISESLRQRFVSSEVWAAESVASINPYGHTLSTVWSLAWQRLSSDAQKLLNQIAFLNPDSIPEDFFTGSGDNEGSEGYWDVQRYQYPKASSHVYTHIISLQIQ